MTAGGAKSLQVAVLYEITVADEPLTSTALREDLDSPQSSVYAALMSLWRAGYIVRRETENEKITEPQYEYALALPETGEVPTMEASA